MSDTLRDRGAYRIPSAIPFGILSGIAPVAWMQGADLPDGKFLRDGKYLRDGKHGLAPRRAASTACDAAPVTVRSARPATPQSVLPSSQEHAAVALTKRAGQVAFALAASAERIAEIAASKDWYQGMCKLGKDAALGELDECLALLRQHGAPLTAYAGLARGTYGNRDLDPWNDTGAYLLFLAWNKLAGPADPVACGILRGTLQAIAEPLDKRTFTTGTTATGTADPVDEMGPALAEVFRLLELVEDSDEASHPTLFEVMAVRAAANLCVAQNKMRDCQQTTVAGQALQLARSHHRTDPDDGRLIDAVLDILDDEYDPGEHEFLMPLLRPWTKAATERGDRTGIKAFATALLQRSLAGCEPRQNRFPGLLAGIVDAGRAWAGADPDRHGALTALVFESLGDQSGDMANALRTGLVACMGKRGALDALRQCPAPFKKWLIADLARKSASFDTALLQQAEDVLLRQAPPGSGMAWAQELLASGGGTRTQRLLAMEYLRAGPGSEPPAPESGSRSESRTTSLRATLPRASDPAIPWAGVATEDARSAWQLWNESGT